jgi:hypothetical protein
VSYKLNVSAVRATLCRSSGDAATRRTAWVEVDRGCVGRKSENGGCWPVGRRVVALYEFESCSIGETVSKKVSLILPLFQMNVSMMNGWLSKKADGESERTRRFKLRRHTSHSYNHKNDPKHRPYQHQNISIL